MQIALTSSLSFFISARSTLQKSSGRMRRQRAGGLRRVSRSGCWRGWPWWLGLWSAHSLPRNACEIHSHHPPPHPLCHPSTNTPEKSKWRRSCLSCQNCWWCLLFCHTPGFPHSFYFPQWTKTSSHIVKLLRRRTVAHICSPPWKICGPTGGRHVFPSFTEPLVPFIPFFSGYCFVFFFHMFACASFNKFWFSHIFTLTTKAKSDSALCDIKSRCAVGPWLLDMSRLDACLACLPPQWALQ